MEDHSKSVTEAEVRAMCCVWHVSGVCAAGFAYQLCPAAEYRGACMSLTSFADIIKKQSINPLINNLNVV